MKESSAQSMAKAMREHNITMPLSFAIGWFENENKERVFTTAEVIEILYALEERETALKKGAV